MPDNIERTIYKLEIDDSGFVIGIDNISGAYRKLVDEVNRTNRILQQNEKQLKTVNEIVSVSEKELVNLKTGNEAYREQQLKSYKDAVDQQKKLNDLVKDSAKAYEEAKRKAGEFGQVASNAAGAASAKIPVPGQPVSVLPTGQIPAVDQITPIQNIQNIADGFDSSKYINGVNNLADAQKILAENVNVTAERLRESQSELDKTNETITRTTKYLAEYTGGNELARANNEKWLKAAQENFKIQEKAVLDNKKAFDLATKSASDFETVAQKAANVKAQNIPAGVAPAVPQEVQGIVGRLETLLSGPVTLNDVTLSVADQFTVLEDAIKKGEEALAGLNTESEEFKALSPLLDDAKSAVEAYKKAVDAGGQSTKSLRQQITELKKTIDILEAPGSNATAEQIEEAYKAVTKLNKAYKDQQAILRVLSSDTRKLDFGKAALQTAINAYQVFAAVQVLAGDSSEEMMKKTQQLFAAMQLLTSLEALNNQIKKGSVLQTNLASAAQATYTYVVGASSLALKAFRLALIGTGIGAAIVLIGYLIQKWQEYTDKVKESNEAVKEAEEYNKQIISGMAAQSVHLNILREKINDHNIAQSERKKLAKQYNEEAEKGNQIDLTQIDNINEVNSAIDRQIEKITARAKARAAENLLTQSEEEVLNARDKALQKADKEISDRKEAVEKSKKEATKAGVPDIKKSEVLPIGTKSALFAKGIDPEQAIKEEQKFNEDVLKTQIIAGDKEYSEALKKQARRKELVKNDISVEGLLNKPKEVKDKVDPKGPENTFLKQRDKLLNDLELAKKGELEGITRINAEYDKKIEDERIRIRNDKGLKGDIEDPKSQRGIILDLEVKVNAADRDKKLKDFNKQVVSARKALNKELQDLDQQNTEAELNLIENDFARRAELITLNEQQAKDNINIGRDDRIEALNEQFKKELITTDEYLQARESIFSEAEQSVTNIVAFYARERQNLAADTFQKTLDSYSQAIDEAGIFRDQKTAEQITRERERLKSGEITYYRFQKNVTKIKKDAEKDREEGDLLVLKSARDAVVREMAGKKDQYTKEYRNLKKEKKNLDKQISDSTNNEGGKDDDKEAAILRAQEVVKYANTVGSLTESIISFWQNANRAEQDALDKSIAIGEKRVEAAQRLADKGNATYLKGEVDKLKQLEVAKANAARREMAINAALQASQLLVAITGAIAKIATPGIGPAEVFAGIATIVAALAAGYGIVKSLQATQPQFYKGTTSVKRDGQPQGRDTIPAWLTEGEAVIPVDKNTSYKKSVEAIYHGKVPADVMNEFVENYTTNKVTNNYVDKYIERNSKSSITNKEEKISTFKNFSESVKNIPTKEIEKFIESYTGARSERLKQIASSQVKTNFIQLPNYQRIKETAENKTVIESGMVKILKEQNQLIKENNELNLQTIKVLKSMGVNVNVDRDGLAISVMEAADKIKINRRV